MAETEEITIDILALEAARLAVENTLIDFRDSGIFVIRANGFVVNNPDGTPNGIKRLSTDMGLAIGIKAYLADLAAREVATNG